MKNKIFVGLIVSVLVFNFPYFFADGEKISITDLENVLNEKIKDLKDGSLNNDINATCFLVLAMNTDHTKYEKDINATIKWLEDQYKETQDFKKKCFITYVELKVDHTENTEDHLRDLIRSGPADWDDDQLLMICLIGQDIKTGSFKKNIEKYEDRLKNEKDRIVGDALRENKVFTLKLAEEYFGKCFFEEKNKKYLLKNFKGDLTALWILLDEKPNFSTEILQQDENNIELLLKYDGKEQATVINIISENIESLQIPTEIKENNWKNVSCKLKTESSENLKITIIFKDRFDVEYKKDYSPKEVVKIKISSPKELYSNKDTEFIFTIENKGTDVIKLTDLKIDGAELRKKMEPVEIPEGEKKAVKPILFFKNKGNKEIKWTIDLSYHDISFTIYRSEELEVKTPTFEYILYSEDSFYNSEKKELKKGFEIPKDKHLLLVIEIINENRVEGDGKIKIEGNKPITLFFNHEERKLPYSIPVSLNKGNNQKIPLSLKFDETGQYTLTIEIDIAGVSWTSEQYSITVKPSLPYNLLIPVAILAVVSLSVSSLYIRKKKRVIYGYKEIKGMIPVLLTAPHAQSPNADLYTGEIVHKLSEETGAWGLISTISRNEIDYNRVEGRETPFRKRIDDLIEKGKVKYILDIHGMKERGLGDVELGTKMGTSASPDFISKLKEAFEKEGIECNIEHIGFTGGDIIEYHSNPPFVEAVQIEISRTLREYYREKIVDILSRFIKRIIMEDRDGR